MLRFLSHCGDIKHVIILFPSTTLCKFWEALERGWVFCAAPIYGGTFLIKVNSGSGKMSLSKFGRCSLMKVRGYGGERRGEECSSTITEVSQLGAFDTFVRRASYHPNNQNYRMSRIQLGLNKWVTQCLYVQHGILLKSTMKAAQLCMRLLFLQDRSTSPIQDQGGYQLLCLWEAPGISQGASGGKKCAREMLLREQGVQDGFP